MEIPAEIVVTDRLGNSKHVKLTKPIFRVGRHADSDLQVLGPSVSRFHAQILFEDGTFCLVDTESKTGTFVNGKRILRHELRDQDRIRLGEDQEQEIQFIDRRDPAKAARESSSGKTPQPIHAHTELQNLARFLEVNQALKISLPIGEVLQLIVDAAIEISHAERGALLLRNEAGILEFKVARDLCRQTLSSESFPLSRTSADQAYREGRSIITFVGEGEDRPVGSESVVRLDLRTIACIPLQRFRMGERPEATGVFQRDMLGVLYVDSRKATGSLSKASVGLLESLAFEAAKALESVRLMQQEEEKRRLEQEIAMAREVQISLLITSTLETEYMEAAAQSLPSRYVDGDFYDLFKLDDGRCAIVLGDVAGKGIAAALLASMAQGVIQAQLSADHSLAATVAGLNRLLTSKFSTCKFITLFCGILDAQGNFVYVNAGHGPPIFLRANGERETLSAQSMVVGAFGFAAYSEGTARLMPGDVLVTYSDGVTEAMELSEEMFGEQRVLDAVRACAGLSAIQIRDQVLQRVAAFTHGQMQQYDDITVLAVRMKAHAHAESNPAASIDAPSR